MTSQRQLSCLEMMQRMCDLLGHPEATIWDRYGPDNRNELLRKLQIIFERDISDQPLAAPTEEAHPEEPMNGIQNCIPKLKPVLPGINALASVIWAQRKYCDGTLLMSPIFVLCVPECEFKANGLNSANFSIRPLFRVAKCFDRSGQTKNCCMVFVDEAGRVYSNWGDFVRNNQFGSSMVVVAPVDGIFHQDQAGSVLLRSHDEHHRVSMHGAASVVGIVASGISAAALFTPLLPVVLMGALVTGVACTSYSVGGGVRRLIDRKHHEQSIGFGNSESRGIWLGIGGGVVGVTAGAAMQGVQVAAQNGKILSQSACIAATSLGAAAIATNGVVLANGFYGFFAEDRRSMLELLQLSSSLFLLTHSIVNFQTARSLYVASQKSTVQSLMSVLSENQQKTFTKMLGQTFREKDAVGYADVFRSLRTIDNNPTTYQNLFNEPMDSSQSSKVYNQSLSDLSDSGLSLLAMDMKTELLAIIGKMSPLTAVQFVWRFYQQNSQLIGEQLNINFDNRFISDVCRIVRFLAQQAGRLTVYFVQFTAEKVIYAKLTMLYENRFLQMVARLAIGTFEEVFEGCLELLSSFVGYIQNVAGFRETILELLENLSHSVVKRLITLSKCSFGALLDMGFHSFVSFDGFFGEVLGVVLQMARENGFQDLSMYVLCLERVDMDKMHERITKQFEWLKNTSEGATKCKECIGHYKISQI